MIHGLVMTNDKGQLRRPVLNLGPLEPQPFVRPIESFGVDAAFPEIVDSSE